jgi:hypothetical protein
MENLFQDLKYSLRMFLRSPGNTLTALAVSESFLYGVKARDPLV